MFSRVTESGKEIFGDGSGNATLVLGWNEPKEVSNFAIFLGNGVPCMQLTLMEYSATCGERRVHVTPFNGFRFILHLGG